MKIQEKSLDKIKVARLAKLKILQDAGIDPYPVSTKRQNSIVEIINNFASLEKNNKIVTIAGRIRSIRKHGKAQFLDIEDESGMLQVFFSERDLGKVKYDLFNKACDEGDIIEATGNVFLTQTKQKTLKASDFVFLVKSLLPLPSKWHGLKNIETRFRKRYLDLILNKSVKNIFKKRSQIIRKIREILVENGFLEVETPILQYLPGGALAQPFKTFLNALDIELYLRVAPELYLKRLLVGGFEKVFELGKNFRNEGIDWYHNPEFTMLEFYWAYQNDEGLRTFTEKFIYEIVQSVNNGSTTVFEGQEINWQPPWPVINFIDVIKEKTGFDCKNMTKEQLFEKAKNLQIELEPYFDKGKIIDEIFKKICRPYIINPTFIIHHPVEVSPLAKRLPYDPSLTGRFQVVVAGMELVNAFAELNDPLDQEQRFLSQNESLKKGDKEAHPFDKDFITALKYGMPPAAGFGMGIDRLTMLITGQSTIRDVILFPFMRPSK